MMKALVLAVLIVVAVSAVWGQESSPAALVTSTSGQATQQRGSAPPKTLGSFDWIESGARVTVEPAGSLTIVLANGARYQLGGSSAARITASGLTERKGDVRDLPRLPALPRIEPIASTLRPSGATGGIRLRGQQIQGLYPSAPATAIAEATALSFHPLKGGETYRVTIEARDGRAIFSVETDNTTVDVPGGLLAPDSLYFWRVESQGSSGARGFAEFKTLSSDAERARDRLRGALRIATTEGVAFAAEVDRRLGLIRQAREQIAAASPTVAGHPDVRRVMERIEAELREHGWIMAPVR